MEMQPTASTEDEGESGNVDADPAVTPTVLEKGTEWLLLYVCAIGYAGITFGRVSLGIASSQMRQVGFLKDGSSLDFGTVQGAATTAYCLGKIFWALVSDRLGGFNNLKVTMGCTVIAGLMCAFSKSDYYFVVFWCIQMFFSSGVWGGTCIVIRENYHESKYGRCLGTLGFFSRLGGTLGALCLTPVGRVAEWQTLFLVGFSVSAFVTVSCLLKLHCGLLQNRNINININAEDAQPAVVDVDGIHLTPLLAAGSSLSIDSIAAGQTQTQTQQESDESDLESLKSFVWRLVHEKRFWIVLSISILLTIIMELQSFVPIFIQSQFHLKLTLCGYGTAFFIAGCMCVPIIGYYYDKMDWKQKLFVMPSLTICAALVCFLLIVLPPFFVMGNVSDAVTLCLVGAILFLASAGASGPYYIIPAEYAFLMGSKQYSGFVMNLLDAISYVFAIIFDIVGYKDAELHGWSSIVFFLISVLIASSGLTFYYYYLPCYDNEARLEHIKLLRKEKAKGGNDRDRERDGANKDSSTHNPLAKTKTAKTAKTAEADVAPQENGSSALAAVAV